jgi:hypothetical protein
MQSAWGCKRKTKLQNLIPLSLVFMGLSTSIFWVFFLLLELGGDGVGGFVVLRNLLTMVVEFIIVVFSNS